MSDRNIMLRWVQGAYVVGIPLFLLTFMVSKLFVLWGIRGYYSALVAPMGAWGFFMLLERYACWVREVVKTCIGLAVMVFLLVWMLERLPVGEGSLIDKGIWKVVLGSIDVNNIVSVCLVVNFLNARGRIILRYKQGKDGVRGLCYGGINLLGWGVLMYGVVAVSDMLGGEKERAYYYLGSIFWFAVGTLVSVGCSIGAVYMSGGMEERERWNRVSLKGDEWLYGRLLALFITVLLLTNVVTVRYVQLGPWLVTAGLLIYPFSFLLTDLMSELYGRRYAEQAVVAGLGASIWMGVWTWVLVALPGDGELDRCFRLFFGFAPGIIVGSMVAYLIGQWLDVQLFDALRRATGGRYLWLRNNVGTITSQLVDTVVFGVIVWEVWPRLGMSVVVSGDVWSRLVVNEYICKVIMALFHTPLLYLLLYLIRRLRNKGVGKSC